MSIEMTGIDKIIKKVKALGREEEYKAALGKACALMERAAKENAPKGVGDLRRSITSEVREENGNIEGIVFTPLEYAPYVEYGTGLFAESEGRTDVPWCYQDDEGNWHSTSGMKPRPFMRPALDDNREEILRILEEAIKK